MMQDEALAILKTGANVFLTGEPGAGKTHTINRFCAYLRERRVSPAITASTGIAATHIGGMTIHAWSGIGIKRDLSPYDIEDIAGRERVAGRIALATTLIVDEISMLDANFLTMLDAVCRRVKNSSRSFGGLQVIFVGDFFQLPPVSQHRIQENNDPDLFENTEGSQSNFAFHSSAWRTANPIVCYLSEQHRQEDEEYLGLLSAIRSNSVEEKDHELLKKRSVPKGKTMAGIPKLFSHNADVDRINTEELNSLSESERVFQMRSQGAQPLVESLKKGCLSPERLVLKIGASVMFTKNNFEEGYVNGTLGTVTTFSKESLPVVKTRSGSTITVSPAEWQLADGSRVLAKITQVPLRLAWAMTVHKSQGMSLDSALIDLSQAFEYGQGYVALSRLRSLSGLYLLGYNARALEVHPELLKRDIEFRSASANAALAFSKFSADELKNMHEAFIKASGGTLKLVPPVSRIESKQKTYDVSALRTKYPNAYKSWEQEEDRLLVQAFGAGESSVALSKRFGRQPGSISSRLKKLGLVK
ncbi:AAA family ATPase [Acetobacteraceae bacterium]|nr:AAA family ATPase [Candidatus Parcubacteria bacterium]